MVVRQFRHVAGRVLPVAQVLVGIRQQQRIRTGRLAHRLQHPAILVNGPLPVVLLPAPHLGLEGARPLPVEAAAQLPDLLQRPPRPARSAVNPDTFHRQPFQIRGAVAQTAFQHAEQFILGQNVAQVMEINALHDLRGRKAGEQLPHRHTLGLGPKVPQRVDDAARRHPVGPERKPAQLVVFHERLGKQSRLLDEVVQIPSDHEPAQRLHRRLLDLVAVPDGENERPPLQTRVRPQDRDHAGIVRCQMARVGPGHAEPNSGVADVEDFEGHDTVLHQTYTIIVNCHASQAKPASRRNCADSSGGVGLM